MNIEKISKLLIVTGIILGSIGIVSECVDRKGNKEEVRYTLYYTVNGENRMIKDIVDYKTNRYSPEDILITLKNGDKINMYGIGNVTIVDKRVDSR